MSQSTATKTPPSSISPISETLDDRRARAGFRALIDEMMAQIRAASRHADTAASSGAATASTR